MFKDLDYDGGGSAPWSDDYDSNSTDTSGSTTDSGSTGLQDTDSASSDSGDFSDTIDEDFYEENSPWEDDDISNEEIEEDLLNRDPYVDTSAPEGESALDPDGESSFTGKSPGTVVEDPDTTGVEPDVENPEDNLVGDNPDEWSTTDRGADNTTSSNNDSGLVGEVSEGVDDAKDSAQDAVDGGLGDISEMVDSLDKKQKAALAAAGALALVIFA